MSEIVFYPEDVTIVKDEDGKIVGYVVSVPPSPLAPLRREEIEILGIYNAERSRGVVHSDVWKAAMAELQARFDAAERWARVPHDPAS